MAVRTTRMKWQQDVPSKRVLKGCVFLPNMPTIPSKVANLSYLTNDRYVNTMFFGFFPSLFRKNMWKGKKASVYFFHSAKSATKCFTLLWFKAIIRKNTCSCCPIFCVGWHASDMFVILFYVLLQWHLEKLTAILIQKANMNTIDTLQQSLKCFRTSTDETVVPAKAFQSKPLLGCCHCWNAMTIHGTGIYIYTYTPIHLPYKNQPFM